MNHGWGLSGGERRNTASGHCLGIIVERGTASHSGGVKILATWREDHVVLISGQGRAGQMDGVVAG